MEIGWYTIMEIAWYTIEEIGWYTMMEIRQYVAASEQTNAIVAAMIREMWVEEQMSEEKIWEYLREYGLEEFPGIEKIMAEITWRRRT